MTLVKRVGVVEACVAGVKGSGYGREVGPEGLQSYLDTKSIAIVSNS